MVMGKGVTWTWVFGYVGGEPAVGRSQDGRELDTSKYLQGCECDTSVPCGSAIDCSVYYRYQSMNQ